VSPLSCSQTTFYAPTLHIPRPHRKITIIKRQGFIEQFFFALFSKDNFEMGKKNNAELALNSLKIFTP